MQKKYGWDRLLNPPIALNSSHEITIDERLIYTLAQLHDVQHGVAGFTPRPMLDDLMRTGAWHHNMSTGHYRVSDGCHSLTIDPARRHVVEYQGAHAESECTEPVDVMPGQSRSWTPHFNNPVQRPDDATNPWRSLLRTASKLPVTILPTAYRFYALYRFGHSSVDGRNFYPVFTAMAEEAVAVHKEWKGLPTQQIRDSHGLRWDLHVRSSGSRKPCISGVHTPKGPPGESIKAAPASGVTPLALSSRRRGQRRN